MTENNSNKNAHTVLEIICHKTATNTKKTLASSGIMLGLIGIGTDADSITLLSKSALVGIVEFAGNMLKTDSEIAQVEAELNKFITVAFNDFREMQQKSAAKNTDTQPASEPDKAASPETPAPDSPAAA